MCYRQGDDNNHPRTLRATFVMITVIIAASPLPSMFRLKTTMMMITVIIASFAAPSDDEGYHPRILGITIVMMITVIIASSTLPSVSSVEDHHDDNTHQRSVLCSSLALPAACHENDNYRYNNDNHRHGTLCITIMIKIMTTTIVAPLALSSVQG